LEVRPTGAKLWRYRYRIAEKENLFAMGDHPALGLAEAREKRAEARKLVKQGLHPAQERNAAQLAAHAANANTFEAVAREWIGQKRARWTPYYARQIEKYFEGDVFPYVGALPIRSVTSAHLLEIIRRVEGRGAATTALLVRQWSSAVFRYGAATLRTDGDPAAALKGAIQRPKTKHAKALSRDDLVRFARALEAYGGYRSTVIALRLMLLTFVRTKELRTAPWTGFNLDRGEWRIPWPRMKMREDHVVPLSRQAVGLLRELSTYAAGRGFLFPNYRNPKTCMTATTLNRALERMGFAGKDTMGFSAHGTGKCLEGAQTLPKTLNTRV
jgi:integrase